MKKLTTNDKKIAVDLLSQGYSKAAASFSMMTRKHVNFAATKVDISIDGREVINYLKKDKEIILLTTSIIGEYSGKSYLLFNKEEAEAVYRACMPYNSDDYLRSMEMEALLKELDNILSAAVITEFSNKLDAVIFGDVPIYTMTNQAQLLKKIEEDLSQMRGQANYFIISNAQFIFDDNTQLCPQFIWKLTDEFLKSLQLKRSQNENSLT